MEQTAASPPTKGEKAEVEQPENSTQALPATEEDCRRRSRTQSSGFRIGVVIAIIVLVIAGFFAYRYFTSYESTDDAEVDGHINPISARISGHVIKLNVDDNQYVPAGTVLGETDPADYQGAYERAKADFDNAQASAIAAGVNVPITGVNTSSQISATDADVNSARAGIQAAQQQFAAPRSGSQQREGTERSGTLQAAGREAGNFATAVRPGDRRRPGQCRGGGSGAGQRRRGAAAGYAGSGQTRTGPGQLTLRQHCAPADGNYSRSGYLRAGGSSAEESRSRSGRVEPAIHKNRCAGEWHRQ